MANFLDRLERFGQTAQQAIVGPAEAEASFAKLRYEGSLKEREAEEEEAFAQKAELMYPGEGLLEAGRAGKIPEWVSLKKLTQEKTEKTTKEKTKQNAVRNLLLAQEAVESTLPSLKEKLIEAMANEDEGKAIQIKKQMIGIQNTYKKAKMDLWVLNDNLMQMGLMNEADAHDAFINKLDPHALDALNTEFRKNLQQYNFPKELLDKSANYGSLPDFNRLVSLAFKASLTEGISREQVDEILEMKDVNKLLDIYNDERYPKILRELSIEAARNKDFKSFVKDTDLYKSTLESHTLSLGDAARMSLTEGFKGEIAGKEIEERVGKAMKPEAFPPERKVSPKIYAKEKTSEMKKIAKEIKKLKDIKALRGLKSSEKIKLSQLQDKLDKYEKEYKRENYIAKERMENAGNIP